MGIDELRTMFRYDKNNKFHRWVRSMIVIASSLVIFVLIWWNLALLIKTAAIPTPDRVWDAFFTLFDKGDAVSGMTMWEHIFESVKRFFAGFLLAMLIAIPIGLLMGSSDTVREFSSPALEILRPIAPIAWAPVLLFATNVVWGPILVVFIGIFFPLMTNTMFGVKKIEPSLIDASKTLGASKVDIFTKVIFPCTIPYMMNGMRIGLGIGWMCIVASEMYASYGGGIGYFVALQASIGYWPNVFAGIAIIAILGILTIGVADLIQKRISKRVGLE